MIPWQLKEAVQTVRTLPERWAHRRRLAAIRRSDEKKPIISFGGVLDQKWIHGGAVKLLSLRDGFRQDETNCNVLYLVSSALPDFAESWVHRCRARGIRFVWNQNGVAYPGWAGAESERYNAPMRRLRALADHLVYQSEFCRLSAEKFLGPTDRPHTVLFNPVNLDQFHPAPELPASPVRLLAAGTHGYRERVTSVLDALEALLNRGVVATLTVAGKMEWPHANAEIAEWIDAHNLPVQILPSFSQEEAVRLFQTHHVLIHPKYLDPCPTIVVEALACGLPVVGSASGGLPEMVAAGSGRLIELPLDWKRLHTPTGEQLADEVMAVLPRLPRARWLARQHALKTFDRQSWIDAHRGIFSQVLNG